MPAHRLLSLVLRAKTALPAAGLGAALLLAPTPARAQSAADKATARELATAGIKLYRAGNYKDALDKVTRAEALYDAPIHLLYIARCQVKLGKVVEGAETYRKLGRVHLAANAPAAFKNAQASGAKELAALVPKIPALRVEVTPANVNDMDVVIDGEHLPPAVVGIDRPADPGKHTVRVTAPGFEAAEATVEVKLGEKKPVKLTLKPGAGGAAAGGAAAGGAAAGGTSPGGTGATSQPGGKQGGSTSGGGGAQTTTGKTKEPTSKKSFPIGFMVGLRLGGVFSTGNAYNQDPALGAGAKMKDFAGPGGGGEIHGGIRLWHYFTPVLFGFGYILKPGGNTQVSSKTTATYQGGGIGVMVGTAPGRLGGFGELDAVFDSVSQSSALKPPATCTAHLTLSGTGARIGGGIVIPVASILELTPYAMVEVEKFDKASEQPCAGLSTPLPASISVTIQKPATHETFFLGVGGDFIFGSDKPSK